LRKTGAKDELKNKFLRLVIESTSRAFPSSTADIKKDVDASAEKAWFDFPKKAGIHYPQCATAENHI
jgi:hypothetical protein